MKSISHKQLYNLIANTKGAAIVGIVALTDAKARKTNNPFGTIFKQIRTVAFVGADYENSVNREMSRQDTDGVFKTETLPWGQWEILNKIISHNGEFYLRTQSTPGQRRIQAAKVLSYRDELGKFVSYEQIKQFLPEARESTKQQAAGLNKTIWVRTYKFSSIQRIRINGETYKMN